MISPALQNLIDEGMELKKSVLPAYLSGHLIQKESNSTSVAPIRPIKRPSEN